jgi:uncharacterized membrane protein
VGVFEHCRDRGDGPFIRGDRGLTCIDEKRHRMINNMANNIISKAMMAATHYHNDRTVIIITVVIIISIVITIMTIVIIIIIIIIIIITTTSTMFRVYMYLHTDRLFSLLLYGFNGGPDIAEMLLPSLFFALW